MHIVDSWLVNEIHMVFCKVYILLPGLPANLQRLYITLTSRLGTSSGPGFPNNLEGVALLNVWVVPASPSSALPSFLFFLVSNLIVGVRLNLSWPEGERASRFSPGDEVRHKIHNAQCGLENEWNMHVPPTGFTSLDLSRFQGEPCMLATREYPRYILGRVLQPVGALLADRLYCTKEGERP